MTDAAPLGNASPFAIRRIWPHERGLIRDHLLRLSSEDRVLRFCHAPNEAFVSSYCDTIDWLRATVLGCFAEGALRGIAELIRIEDARPASAELALSVEAPYQNRGIGSALLRHALVTARNRMIGTVYMICLLENRRMQHIARKFAASLVIREGQVEGEILPPWPSYLSLVEELATEGQTLFRAAFEVPLAAAPRALDETA